MISARNFGLDVAGFSGGEELVKCPFHEDKTPSAWFNPKKGVFWCSVCQLGLNIQQLENILGVDLDMEELVQGVREYDLIQEPMTFDVGLSEYDPYFTSRNINSETIAMYGVRWKEEAPAAAVFLQTNVAGAIYGVVYRYVDPEQAGTRYRKVGVQYPLWPMHFLSVVPTGTTILVTEGAWSAMRLAMALKRTFPDWCAVALMGARASHQIVDILRPFNPVFLYDNDRSGRNACRKMRKLAPTWLSYVLSKAPDDRDDIENIRLVDSIAKRISA